MARAVDVAAAFARLSEGALSHLALQKYVYLAHMLYAGENAGARLVTDGEFQAWDYGPVSTSLYSALRGFGSEPVPPVVLRGSPLLPDQMHAVREIWSELGSMSASRLVDITHSEIGAWKRVYRAGARGTVIPQSEILNEYERRANR